MVCAAKATSMRKQKNGIDEWPTGPVCTNLAASQAARHGGRTGRVKKDKGSCSARLTRGPIMLTLQSDLHGNHLLGALPSHEWQAIAPHLELVHLRTEQLLCDSGQRIHHVYFPTTAIISMLSTMEDGGSVEIAAVGREGMTG